MRYSQFRSDAQRKAVFVRMNNKNLALAFASGRTKGKGNNMFIDGDIIYSYGYHFPIAKRYGNRALITKKKYSQTTSKHTNIVKGALKSAGFEVFDADDLRLNDKQI